MSVPASSGTMSKLTRAADAAAGNPSVNASSPVTSSCRIFVMELRFLMYMSSSWKD
jgi:hypothetical protein